MSFVIPLESEWPDAMNDGLVSLSSIQSGNARTSGPTALVIADKWIRVHSQRSICSSGMLYNIASTSLVRIISLLGYISPEAEGIEILWDRVEPTGTTSLKVTVTYDPATPGASDTHTFTFASATRSVVRRDLTPFLANYTDGIIKIDIEVSNSTANGAFYGITLIETPLTSI